jgi:hypothetical protein
MNRIIISILLSFSLVGCTAFGPKEGSPEFITTVNVATHPSKIVVAKSALWIPNIFGYNNIMNETSISGVFVLTQNEVLFLIWNEDKSEFVRATNIQRIDINQAIVDSFGRCRRLVIASKDKVNSFELVDSNQNFCDTEAIDKVTRILNHQESH